MSTESAAPVHKLRLTNGAVMELARLASIYGLLRKSHHVRRVTQFMRDNVLRRLPEYRGDHAGMVDWSDEEFGTFEIREKVRDALKALVQSAQENGQVSCSLGCGDLLVIFGLADDEG